MKVSQQEEGPNNLPEGPVRWSWRVFLTVTLNSASAHVHEVADYLTDVSHLLVKDYQARREDKIRLELESFEGDH